MHDLIATVVMAGGFTAVVAAICWRIGSHFVKKWSRP